MSQVVLHYQNLVFVVSASLIGTLNCLFIKTKKVPIYTNFMVVMTFVRRFRSLLTHIRRRLSNHLKFDLFANSAFEFSTLTVKRYKFYSCLDVVVMS